MPKKRKESGTRKIEKKIFILCEGADKHSEYAYLGALIKDKPCKRKSCRNRISSYAKEYWS